MPKVGQTPKIKTLDVPVGRSESCGRLLIRLWDVSLTLV